MGNESSSSSGPGPYPGRVTGRRPPPPPEPQQQSSPVRQQRMPRVMNTEPGVFEVLPMQQPSGQIRARVRIPPGVRPGQHFPVMLEGQQVMVRCPDRVNPGDMIAVEFQQSTFIVQVPDGVRPGQTFDVMVRGQRQRVTCPDGVRPGMQIRFSLPPTNGGVAQPPPAPDPTPFEKLYEVEVPLGVRPGEPFVLLADGQRVTVTCPLDARPKQKIRFKLPIVPTNEQLQAYQLTYNKDGWVRCLGVDLKFHWYRHEAKKEGEEGGGGSSKPRRGEGGVADSLAFVRQLGTDGLLTLVKPEVVAIETTVQGSRINFHTLSKGAQLPFEQKVEFFRSQCAAIRTPWEKGHLEIRVRRSSLLADSLYAMERIPKDGMRKIFRFEFLGEPGIDAGGVAREWFDQVTDALFNPDFGLFQYSGVDQMCMQINPASGLVEQGHERYFRFVGRVLAKALFDGQIVRHHLVRPLYKHILGWPVVLADLEYLDSETYTNLVKLQDIEGLEDLCVDFTISENLLGESRVIDLVPGGAGINLTKANLDRYFEANLKYRLCNRFNSQLKQLLIGFYEVVPEALLSIFDFQQLELLLCGLPNIDIEDWMRNTEYGGEYTRQGPAHKVVQWFWEVVRDDFDQEQRARLLQFTTGTSGVPAQGFAFLQGNDANIRKFTINSIRFDQSIFPRAHTCFNRIDLPLYKTKKELKQNLSLAIQMEATGFSID